MTDEHVQDNQPQPGSFWSAAFLTAGTMIGVGLLAVPVLLGLAGFVPGLILLVAMALLVWTSGYMLAERVMDRRMPEADLNSLYQADLGPSSRWITLPGYILLFYALLVAYLTGAAETLEGLLPFDISKPVWILLVSGMSTALFLLGNKLFLHCNKLIVLAMIGAFAILLYVSMGRLQTSHLTGHNWAVAPFALPVLACAFAYHNVIPLVCRHQQWERGRTHAALSTGLLIALAMTALWFIVVAGTIPLSSTEGPSLLAAFQQGIPATVPLAQMLQSRIITLSGLAFSLLAILTSYLGVGAALISFLRDALPALRAPRRAPCLPVLVFLPPLLLALWQPGLFLRMVDAAGGLGMILLFGILPTLAFMRRRAWDHPLRLAGLAVILALFIGVFVIEAAQEAGLIHIPVARE